MLPAREFERFRIDTEVEVIFPMKEMRTVVAFANAFALPVDIYFDRPGRCVLLELTTILLAGR